MAGRLIQSGHDPEWHCRFEDKQCHFIQVALNYVRAGAPNPSKPVLVLDRSDLDVNFVLNKIYGAGGVPTTIVDPRSGTFTTTPLDTNHWSAIYVASDQTCGGCDLNEIPTGSCAPTPCNASTPDSTAIAARTDDIAAFFAAGGGLMVGAGAADATGNYFGSPLSFSATNVPYYTFLNTSGAGNAAPPFSLTSLGSALGFIASDVCSTCGTHNSFGPPPAGSDLKTVERDNAGRFVTLAQDTDPPVAAVTSGPSGATASRTARFAFRSNEGGSKFQCRIDNALFGACASPWTAPKLADGRHTFNVRAIDLVGNVQPTPTSFSWCQPGGNEVTGNKVDEDCNGFSAPYQAVDASIRFGFRFTGRFTRVTQMNLSRVSGGARARVTCRGKGCPFKSKRVTLRRGKAKLSRIFKKRGRRAKLRRGARIRISLTRSGWTSKVYSFKVRRGALPNFATKCQLPGTKTLRSRCPEFR